MRRGQTEEQIPVNSALLNVVTPMGLEFQKNRLSVGENLGKIYGIIRYPQKVDVEWNGYTSVSSDAQITVMDTHALQETGDNVKRTQYFNILTYDWEQMSRDRNERVLLICDEAYLMIDQKVPQSLVYLRNVMKRARKYEAALGIISHSLVDFLGDAIKQYGQALLDIPCYKILMGTDGKNLKETADLYDLTEAEQELLLSRKRGHALFMVGAKRLHIQFDIPEYKFKYMGAAGGR